MHRVSPYPIGCEASPSVPSETVVADGWTVFLLFFAVSEQINPATGYLDDLGVGILEFTGCVCLQFGYPNDEGLPEHPLYEHGLSDLSCTVGEVIDSDWARYVGTQMRAWYLLNASRRLLRARQTIASRRSPSQAMCGSEEFATRG